MIAGMYFTHGSAPFVSQPVMVARLTPLRRHLALEQLQRRQMSVVERREHSANLTESFQNLSNRFKIETNNFSNTISAYGGSNPGSRPATKIWLKITP